MERVPPEPPHATLHGHICQWLLHVPSVPQQDVLIVAESDRQSMCRNTKAHSFPGAPRGQETSPRDTHPTHASWTKSPFYHTRHPHSGLRAGPTTHRSRQPKPGRELPEGPLGADLGLTFPWPRRAPGGGCSECCTRPWSVCEQKGRAQRAPGSAHGGRGELSGLSWPLDDLPLAAEQRCARGPGVPAF